MVLDATSFGIPLNPGVEALREDAACDAYMARLQQAFEFVSNIGVTGPDGVVRCLNEPFERGRVSNADRRHFRVAMSGA